MIAAGRRGDHALALCFDEQFHRAVEPTSSDIALAACGGFSPGGRFGFRRIAGFPPATGAAAPGCGPPESHAPDQRNNGPDTQRQTEARDQPDGADPAAAAATDINQLRQSGGFNDQSRDEDRRGGQADQ